MSEPESVPPVGEPGVEEHTHHWLIGDQEGPSSPGVCKECGERREFSNSFVPRKSSWLPRSGSARQETSEDSADGGEA